jgi:hypothetical protein
MMCQLRAKHKQDKNFKPFPSANTRDAINAAKRSSATDPEFLMAIHLKHLGPHCMDYLTNLFNLSVSNVDIPSIWKAAVIVPVLKPGKPASEGSSYRTISLLSPSAKVLECLLLPFIMNALPKSLTQHGFAPGHSCTSALLPFTTNVAIGFNDNKLFHRSALCVIDILKAFNSINHTLLIEQISSSVFLPSFV